MNSALYIGATGMKSLAEGMNVVSNNLANVSTLGYKQQNMQFSDLMYSSQGSMGQAWGNQENSFVAMGQLGHGVQVDSVRTLFTEGSYEPSDTASDLSISGKGFFQVINAEGNELYTRAGDFRFDKQGVLRAPAGETLTGYAINANGSRGELGPIKVNPFEKVAAQPTKTVELGVNLGFKDDKSTSATDPYFGLVNAWDGTKSPPLNAGQYGYSQALTVYDSAGTAHEVTAYFDGAPGTANNRTMEFVIGTPPGAPATAGGGLLMSGTLNFDAAGQLVDMTAFTPGGGDNKDLKNWTMAPLAGGLPQFSLGGQTMSLNLGVRSSSGWANAPASAADVGTDLTKLPSISPLKPSADACTAFSGSSSTNKWQQDGFGEGTMVDLGFNKNGEVFASFSNGQTKTLFEIPICRFTSEDGLRREGGNMFSATKDAGTMQMGRAGTDNYGALRSNSLETSNVDMAREMVNMIVTQRGFQSNSKAVTTADTMLQKAMELKR